MPPWHAANAAWWFLVRLRRTRAKFMRERILHIPAIFLCRFSLLPPALPIAVLHRTRIITTKRNQHANTNIPTNIPWLHPHSMPHWKQVRVCTAVAYARAWAIMALHSKPSLHIVFVFSPLFEECRCCVHAFRSHIRCLSLKRRVLVHPLPISIPSSSLSGYLQPRRECLWSDKFYRIQTTLYLALFYGGCWTEQCIAHGLRPRLPFLSIKQVSPSRLICSWMAIRRKPYRVYLFIISMGNVSRLC